MANPFRSRKNLEEQLEEALKHILELEKALVEQDPDPDAAAGNASEEALLQALEDSQHRRLETAALLAASRAVLEYQDFEKAARAIFDICRDLIGATSGYVALLSKDSSENEVVFLDSGGLPCTVDESLPMPIRGLRAEAYKSGRAVYDNDFHNSGWMKFMPEGHVELRNVLFAPLSIKGETVGLLGLANKQEDFGEEDTRLVTAFGELVAIALLNDWTYESLERSEQRYRSLAQSANDAIVSADATGDVISWNEGAEDIFGYTEEEMLGQSLTGIMPDGFRQDHIKGIQRFLDTRQPRMIGHTVEMTGLRKDGSEFPIELSLSSWETAEGTFFTGIIRDISERRQAELSELDTRAKVQSYASQLAVLHDIGLSLNRETDKPRLLKNVLKAAAELTSAGLGVMTVVRGGQTDIISVYYAPWYEKRCEIGEEIPSLHRRIARMVKEGADSTRLGGGSDFENLPDGHLELRGLMIGALRDTKGRARGHFLLSDKADEAEFTPEDEEVIALLAAQSSVALVSAENLEREHVVAESLQDALLPEPPVRDDLEVGLLYQSAGPFGKIGGDFYDFVELDNNRVAFVVGDVCGKGLSAATYTAMIKYMLRAYLGEGMSPGDCLSKLNSAVHKQVPIEKFVTLSLAVLDTSQARVSFSSAGHPAPLICEEGKAKPLPIRQAVPLGVIAGQQYETGEASLVHSCSITMYTDGLLDARPEGGVPFGEQRVIEALSGRCCDPAQQVTSDLISAAVEYSGDNLKDDIALLVVRMIEKTSKM